MAEQILHKLNKFQQQRFNTNFSVNFGLVWNEMQSSPLVKTDACRNHENCMPTHTAKLVED